jgi:cell division protein FtsB
VRLEAQQKTLDRLRNDPDYVEQVIRRKLGYAKPDETVYRFED